MSHPQFIASAYLFESPRLDSVSPGTLRTAFSRSETAMFKDGPYTSSDGGKASHPALTAAQRFKLLSALERELTGYLVNEVVPCVPPNRNAASARLLSAILHCSTDVGD